MNSFLSIYKRELKSFFTTPIAYVILAAFLGFTGFFFYNILSYFGMMSFQSLQYAQMYKQQTLPMNVNAWVVSPFFFNIGVIILFLIPLLTMRSFAEEKRMGTIELLITSPISTTSMVLAKFFASYTIFLSMLLLTFINQAILFIVGKPDLYPILSGYLGFALMGAGFVAIGLFMSALTENQIVSAILSFAILLILWVVDWASIISGGTVAEVLRYLSIPEHFRYFVRGVIDSSGVIYFLSFTAVGLFLSGQAIESWRWRD